MSGVGNEAFNLSTYRLKVLPILVVIDVAALLHFSAISVRVQMVITAILVFRNTSTVVNAVCILTHIVRGPPSEEGKDASESDRIGDDEEVVGVGMLHRGPWKMPRSKAEANRGLGMRCAKWLRKKWIRSRMEDNVDFEISRCCAVAFLKGEHLL